METTEPGMTSRMSSRKRAALAVLLGGSMFAAGYALLHTGVVEQLYSALGGKTPGAQAAPIYSRAQMEEDRKKLQNDPRSDRPRTPVDAQGFYIPPSEASIPKNAYGDAVRRGRAIFTETGLRVKDHVGNALACANCHLDAGRRHDSAPMWGAYGAYPAFRAKTGAISTLEDRIMGCFTYSMNAQGSSSGSPPAAGSDVYRDLMTYMAWMANGAPAGEKLPGALYPKLPKPALAYDPKRGATVYQQNCALCHGSQGQGRTEADGTVRFPPLWGAQSYNWGAGMARIDTAAGFIKANMPLGKPNSLSDQDAWDVAAYINSRERPKDPRQTGTVAQAAEKDHAGEQSYYGKMLEGRLIGVGTGASGG